MLLAHCVCVSRGGGGGGAVIGTGDVSLILVRTNYWTNTLTAGGYWLQYCFVVYQWLENVLEFRFSILFAKFFRNIVRLIVLM